MSSPGSHQTPTSTVLTKIRRRDLFFTLGTNWSSTRHTSYVPSADNSTSAVGPDAADISALESLDVYAQLDFADELEDVVDGVYPAGSPWHNGTNNLGATKDTPYFVANGWGPKYLNSHHGYQIVQPLLTAAQSADTKFTQSTISINGLATSVAAVPECKFTCSSAFVVQEGQLSIRIQGYPAATLETGDTAFIPRNVSYKYWSVPAFTKVLYVSAEVDGLDSKSIEEGKFWDFVSFPVN